MLHKNRFHINTNGWMCNYSIPKSMYEAHYIFITCQTFASLRTESCPHIVHFSFLWISSRSSFDIDQQN